MGITFTTDNRTLQARFDAALEGLRRNVVVLPGCESPVLIEGAEYAGIWLECGPHEASLYGAIAPQVALASHRIFFDHQHEDGYLPCYFRRGQTGTAQVQSVVPIAATALETYELTGDVAFLEDAYTACGRFDGWLARFRDTRGTGLREIFCEWDTGHDNSPRVAAFPHACPEGDARRCPDGVPGAPYLAPDLSATVYGGRVALARMARILGRDSDAALWEERAEKIRQRIVERCFDPETNCFYDVDTNDRFVKIRGDAMLRVLSEHVVEQELFEAIYAAQVKNPAAFWTPYPLPSIAADDPAFARFLPHNSWGGASQALTALRAPRWFPHYGKYADLTVLMGRWVEALARADGFRQQLNPWTGEMLPAADGYSPAMLVLLEYVTRLYGVRPEGDRIEWNCRLPGGATRSVYRRDTARGVAEITVSGDGAALALAGKELMTVRGACRIVTDLSGRPLSVVETEPEAVEVRIAFADGATRSLTVPPDEVVDTDRPSR